MIDVSRETLARLTDYLDILRHWQRAINLVGRTTLDDPWRRHILDCAQLMPHLPPEPARIVDLGSGAGLPGLILAILGRSEVELVDSDRRKAQFLREAARRVGVRVRVHTERIERLGDLSADVITARALAPLPDLLDLAAPLIGPHTVCLLHKGRQGHDELTNARKSWMMSAQTIQSLSDPSAIVLKLWGIGRASIHCQ